MTDFRGRTCGECAWYYHLEHVCRRGGVWSNDGTHAISTICNTKPACPAFVPMEREETEQKVRKCPKCGTSGTLRRIAHLTDPVRYSFRCSCGHQSKAFLDYDDAIADFYKPISKEPTHDTP